MAGIALSLSGGASLVFGAIGSAVGGPLGGFIGSSLGSMLDNQLHPTKVEGPRLEDLSVQSSAYGALLPILYGPDNRLSGQMIWSTGLIEHKAKQREGGKGGPVVETTEYTYTCSFAIALSTGRPFNRVKKILANGKAIYDVDAGVTDWGLYEAVRIYTGTSTQLPDPAIQADLGIGNTSAFRDTGYVVFEHMQLADFGNRLPNLEFFIEADEEINTDVIITHIVTSCGIDPNTVSTMGARAVCRGYTMSGNPSGLGALQPLALAYNFDLCEDSGQMVCVSKTAPPAGVVQAMDYGGHDGADDVPENPILWNRGVETDLPKTSFVRYLDPGRDLQVGTQRDDRRFGNAQNSLSAELPLTLTPDEARLVAQRALWEAWDSRQTATLATDDRWISLRVGRKYLFETPAGLEAMKIVRKTRGENGVIDIEVRRQNSEIYILSTSGAETTVPENIPHPPGPSEIILLDIPLLLEEDGAKPYGFYWGVVGSGEGWRGAQVMRSLTLAGEYYLFGSTGLELTVGTCSGTLGPFSSSSMGGAWDMDSVLRVELRRTDMVLEGAEAEDVEAGINTAYIGPEDGHGGELVGFMSAAYVAPGVYDISGLLRGRRCTYEYVDAHGSGDMFVLLERGALQRIDFGADDLGNTRYYKAVSVLTAEVDAIAIPFANDGAGLHGYCGSQFMLTEDDEDIVTEDGEQVVTENV